MSIQPRAGAVLAAAIVGVAVAFAGPAARPAAATLSATEPATESVSGTATPAPQAGAGQVFVVQGLSGRNLDVAVDGEVVQPAAKPKTVVGPLRLSAGDHQVSLRDAGAVVADASVEVRSGQSLDVVAHPDATSGTSAAITSFRNDLAPVRPGKVRLTVAHTAAAPPADITVDGKVLFSNVANSEALTVVVPAGTYRVAIVPAATSGDPILGPVDLPVRAGTLSRVFAIGDVREGTMDAVVHALPVQVAGSGPPSQVQTGDGGQAAPWARAATAHSGPQP